MRIAVGGFQHETNTFAPSKATFEDFERADAWPPLTRGQGMAQVVSGINLPVAGALEYIRDQGHEILPLVWASAPPSAHVTEDAFERIVAMLLEDLKKAGPLDGVYLDLHGAMVTEHLEDGEGAILKRVRDLLGPNVPLAVSLDLHANVTPEMVDLADILEIYRTYPHVDMAATGARAAERLEALLNTEERWHKAFLQLPFLIPLTGGCTFIDPSKSLYEKIPHLIDENQIVSLSFACGFSPADIYHVGASVVAYGKDSARVWKVAEEFRDAVIAREAEFAGDLFAAPDAVRKAREISAVASRPVVLADTQDNPGAGGNGDTTGLLKELVAQHAEKAVVGVLCDPASAAGAHDAGVGADIRLSLGGKSGWPGVTPLEGTFKVLALSDGKTVGTGPFYKGANIDLGKTALLEISGVKVIVGSRKIQAADQSMFRTVGIEPSSMGILALKSSVHFRADFQPIAEKVLVAASPGPNPVDYESLAYRRVRPGIRLMPGSSRTS
ncbi:M81 family metallopeptidase [Limibacillus halophilus]|uniref:Microcystinase C n=1 Tax=Limibacillus halophilus TaxID=1579333 RepID=A0A839SU66_9PROT|nr:M81 family metallopeptidase [Limibacillus halophilus]MBB3065539.1 microcystin degradation protein MlrC [Limibacillus halophilus]